MFPVTIHDDANTQTEPESTACRWETGYWRSMDIMHDRAGYYICWGCLVWVPAVYTSPAMFLTTHGVDSLPAAAAVAIAVAGAAAIYVNYNSDRQRQVRDSLLLGRRISLKI